MNSMVGAHWHQPVTGLSNEFNMILKEKLLGHARSAIQFAPCAHRLRDKVQAIMDFCDDKINSQTIRTYSHKMSHLQSHSVAVSQ